MATDRTEDFTKIAQKVIYLGIRVKKPGEVEGDKGRTARGKLNLSRSVECPPRTPSALSHATIYDI